MAIATQRYKCLIEQDKDPHMDIILQKSQGTNWLRCTKSMICNNTKNITYKVDKTRPDYFENWYTKDKLICENPSKYAQVGFAYFIGYFCGVVLFPLPDALGRKGSLILILTIYSVALAIQLTYDDMWIKKLSYFIQGLLHIRTTSIYQHCYELLPSEQKSVATTFINMVDQLGLFIVAICLKFLTKDIDQVFMYNFVMGLIATLIYIVAIPESPKWLLLKEGP